MRRALIITSLLLVLSIAGVCVAHANINAMKDQVKLSEKVILGEKSDAQGVTVNLKTHYDYHLFWNTTYVAGQEPICSTDFFFSPEERREDNPENYMGVRIESHIDCGWNDYAVSSDNVTGIMAAFKELYDSTPAGQKGSRVINVKDYCTYYPLGVQIDIPGNHLSWAGDFWTDVADPGTEAYKILKFRDFFKIPVLHNQRYEIYIVKDSDGNVIESGSGDVDGEWLDIRSQSVLTEDKCFFTFNTHANEGRIVDTSQIPGGYGIYCLPYFYNTVNKQQSVINMDGLSMVYALDPEVKLVKLSISKGKERLLLYTYEKEGYVLTVIDAETMETIQRLELGEQEDENLQLMYEGDNFITAAFYSGHMVVASLTDTGGYEISIDTQISNTKDPLYYLRDGAEMDCDGQRLVISDFLLNERGIHETCGFYLAMYNKDGLYYYGEYDSSLSQNFSYKNYYYNFWPSDYRGIEVGLPEK